MNNSNITTPKANVLVIDDELTFGMGIAEYLNEENIIAYHAISAEKGLGFLVEHKEIDIVLLDINLGSGLNGIETLEILKNQYKFIQIVMMSSMDTLEIAVECMKKGAFDYMTKPFDNDKFIEKIPVMLDKKKLAQMNEIYLGIIVHDLRNPLSNIKIALNAIFASISNENKDRFKSVAMNGVKQIEMMVNNIINVTRFEKGLMVIKKEKILLKEDVQSLLETFNDRKELSQSQLEIIYEINDNYILNNDKEFFFQVLWNIVSNAYRFSLANKKIMLNLKEVANNFLQISITNQGSYIEEKDRINIFDKFNDAYLDKSKITSRNFGLGLTYSKMAVDLMGGKIWVESNNVGVETTTFIYTVKNFEN